jgi:phospholipid-translocating ATPase
MLKEAYDDYFRHQQDKTENNSIVKRLNVIQKNGTTSGTLFRSRRSTPEQPIELLPSRPDCAADWMNVPCHSLQVGDIIMLQDHETVPADLVVLKSSGENGTAYIETANLDGETNLKQRQALKETQSQLEDITALSRYHGMCLTPLFFNCLSATHCL